MAKSYRPTEDKALARLKNLTAEDIIQNSKNIEGKEDITMKGFFGRSGSRGRRSAEAEALSDQPLDKSEVTNVEVTKGTAVVTTESGRDVVMSVAEARKLGLM